MSELNEKRRKTRRKSKKYDSISYTTGDIGLNIDHFNKRMGTFSSDTISDTVIGGEASSAGGESGGALCEAKRYVRRYYIRPQNIFCSNKAEILKTLIDLDNENCSIYTLNNLGDEKDVSKLMNSDIIYYYDDGILYDKNKVKVMDYDLSIKHEENRKHIANVTKTSDKEFKDVYYDRMTDATELEEAVEDNSTVDDVFDLDFETYNVFGEKLAEAQENFCCICGEPLNGYGNNPEPYADINDGYCCDGCNLRFVLPARLDAYESEREWM